MPENELILNGLEQDPLKKKEEKKSPINISKALGKTSSAESGSGVINISKALGNTSTVPAQEEVPELQELFPDEDIPQYGDPGFMDWFNARDIDPQVKADILAGYESNHNKLGTGVSNINAAIKEDKAAIQRINNPQKTPEYNIDDILKRAEGLREEIATVSPDLVNAHDYEPTFAITKYIGRYQEWVDKLTEEVSPEEFEKNKTGLFANDLTTKSYSLYEWWENMPSKEVRDDMLFNFTKNAYVEDYVKGLSRELFTVKDDQGKIIHRKEYDQLTEEENAALFIALAKEVKVKAKYADTNEGFLPNLMAGLTEEDIAAYNSQVGGSKPYTIGGEELIPVKTKLRKDRYIKGDQYYLHSLPDAMQMHLMTKTDARKEAVWEVYLPTNRTIELIPYNDVTTSLLNETSIKRTFNSLGEMSAKGLSALSIISGSLFDPKTIVSTIGGGPVETMGVTGWWNGVVHDLGMNQKNISKLGSTRVLPASSEEGMAELEANLAESTNRALADDGEVSFWEQTGISLNQFGKSTMYSFGDERNRSIFLPNLLGTVGGFFIGAGASNKLVGGLAGRVTKPLGQVVGKSTLGKKIASWSPMVGSDLGMMNPQLFYGNAFNSLISNGLTGKLLGITESVDNINEAFADAELKFLKNNPGLTAEDFYRNSLQLKSNLIDSQSNIIAASNLLTLGYMYSPAFEIGKRTFKGVAGQIFRPIATAGGYIFEGITEGFEESINKPYMDYINSIYTNDLDKFQDGDLGSFKAVKSAINNLYEGDAGTMLEFTLGAGMGVSTHATSHIGRMYTRGKYNKYLAGKLFDNLFNMKDGQYETKDGTFVIKDKAAISFFNEYDRVMTKLAAIEDFSKIGAGLEASVVHGMMYAGQFFDEFKEGKSAKDLIEVMLKGDAKNAREAMFEHLKPLLGVETMEEYDKFNNEFLAAAEEAFIDLRADNFYGNLLSERAQKDYFENKVAIKYYSKLLNDNEAQNIVKETQEAANKEEVKGETKDSPGIKAIKDRIKFHNGVLNTIYKESSLSNAIVQFQNIVDKFQGTSKKKDLEKYRVELNKWKRDNLKKVRDKHGEIIDVAQAEWDLNEQIRIASNVSSNLHVYEGISENVLERIAYKLSNGIGLSDKQKHIYTAKKAEVESLIDEKSHKALYYGLNNNDQQTFGKEIKVEVNGKNKNGKIVDIVGNTVKIKLKNGDVISRSLEQLALEDTEGVTYEPGTLVGALKLPPGKISKNFVIENNKIKEDGDNYYYLDANGEEKAYPKEIATGAFISENKTTVSIENQDGETEILNKHEYAQFETLEKDRIINKKEAKEKAEDIIKEQGEDPDTWEKDSLVHRARLAIVNTFNLLKTKLRSIVHVGPMKFVGTFLQEVADSKYLTKVFKDSARAKAYLILNNGYFLMYAKNGKRSKVFMELLRKTNYNHDMSNKVKAFMYTKSFIKWFDYNWITPKEDQTDKRFIDENGEPQIYYIHTMHSDGRVSITKVPTSSTAIPVFVKGEVDQKNKDSYIVPVNDIVDIYGESEKAAERRSRWRVKGKPTKVELSDRSLLMHNLKVSEVYRDDVRIIQDGKKFIPVVVDKNNNIYRLNNMKYRTYEFLDEAVNDLLMQAGIWAEVNHGDIPGFFANIIPHENYTNKNESGEVKDYVVDSIKDDTVVSNTNKIEPTKYTENKFQAPVTTVDDSITVFDKGPGIAVDFVGSNMDILTGNVSVNAAIMQDSLDNNPDNTLHITASKEFNPQNNPVLRVAIPEAEDLMKMKVSDDLTYEEWLNSEPRETDEIIGMVPMFVYDLSGRPLYRVKSLDSIDADALMSYSFSTEEEQDSEILNKQRINFNLRRDVYNTNNGILEVDYAFKRQGLTVRSDEALPLRDAIKNGVLTVIDDDGTINTWADQKVNLKSGDKDRLKGMAGILVESVNITPKGTRESIPSHRMLSLNAMKIGDKPSLNDSMMLAFQFLVSSSILKRANKSAASTRFLNNLNAKNENWKEEHGVDLSSAFGLSKYYSDFIRVYHNKSNVDMIEFVNKLGVAFSMDNNGQIKIFADERNGESFIQELRRKYNLQGNVLNQTKMDLSLEEYQDEEAQADYSILSFNINTITKEDLKSPQYRFIKSAFMNALAQSSFHMDGQSLKDSKDVVLFNSIKNGVKTDTPFDMAVELAQPYRELILDSYTTNYTYLTLRDGSEVYEVGNGIVLNRKGRKVPGARINPAKAVKGSVTLSNSFTVLETESDNNNVITFQNNFDQEVQVNVQQRDDIFIATLEYGGKTVDLPGTTTILHADEKNNMERFFRNKLFPKVNLVLSNISLNSTNEREGVELIKRYMNQLGSGTAPTVENLLRENFPEHAGVLIDFHKEVGLDPTDFDKTWDDLYDYLEQRDDISKEIKSEILEEKLDEVLKDLQSYENIEIETSIVEDHPASIMIADNVGIAFTMRKGEAAGTQISQAGTVITYTNDGLSDSIDNYYPLLIKDVLTTQDNIDLRNKIREMNLIDQTDFSNTEIVELVKKNPEIEAYFFQLVNNSLKENHQLKGNVIVNDTLQDLVNVLSGEKIATKEDKKDDKLQREILKQYKGKIVYSSPGTGKSQMAKKFANVVDLDEIVLAEMIERYKGGEAMSYRDRDASVPIESVEDLKKNYALVIHSDPTEKYADFFRVKARELADEGKTVLTANWFMADTELIDYAFVFTPMVLDKRAVKYGKVSQSLRDREANLFKKNVGAEEDTVSYIGEREFIEDVLTQDKSEKLPEELSKEIKKQEAATLNYVFENNPELKEIGTKEQYSEYLSTIFPDSAVKDILYHGTRSGGKFEKFDDESMQKYDSGWYGKGFYFTGLVGIADSYSKMPLREGDVEDRAIRNAIVNIKDPQYIDYNLKDTNTKKEFSKKYLDKTKDAVISYSPNTETKGDVTDPWTEIKVNSSEQIYILGTKEDIKGFKDFVKFKKVTDEKVLVSADQIRAEIERLKNVKTPLGKLVSIFDEKGLLEGIGAIEIGKTLYQEGSYNIEKKKIVAKAKHERMLNRVLVHEMIHHIAQDKIEAYLEKNPRENVGTDPYINLAPATVELTEQEEAGIKNLLDIYNRVLEDKENFKSKYGFNNIHEFITEAFTNPKFINELKEMPSIHGKKSNLFRNFVESLFKMFGVEENVSIIDDIYNGFEEVFVTDQAEETKVDRRAESLELLKKLEDIGLVKRDCKGSKKAKDGMSIGYTRGGRWEMVKEFTGNSHKEGGIDIVVGNGTIKMSRGKEDFKAKYGVVVAADGLLLDKEDNQEPKKKKRVVVLAEAEKDVKRKHHLFGPSSINLPPELEAIKTNYFVNKEIANERMKKIFDESERDSKVRESIYLMNLKKEVDPIKRQEITKEYEKVKKDRLDMFGKRRDVLRNAVEDIEIAFEQHELNPVSQQSEFITEAENIKTFYKDNPDVDVEVYPIYDEHQRMEDIIEGLGEEDDLVVMGHSGNRLAGVSNFDIADMIRRSKVKNCYFGSCSFERNISEDFAQLKDRNIYYRPADVWLGFNPNAKEFIEGMYSRAISKGKVSVVEPEEGLHYKVYKGDTSIFDKQSITDDIFSIPSDVLRSSMVRTMRDIEGNVISRDTIR